MTKLEMEFYKDGVTFRWKWRNEEEYRAALAFLEHLLGYTAMKAGDIDFFYFEDKNQFDELVAFRHTLEAGR